MNPEKSTQENEQLEKNEIESTLPDYKPVSELTNEEIDEIAPVEFNEEELLEKINEAMI